MYIKPLKWKFSIHKQANGMVLIVHKDLDMAVGFMKNPYLFMEDFN